MKKFAILAAMAAMAVVFVPVKAIAASGGGVALNVSATIKTQSTNSTQLKGVVISESLNEKGIYNLISNAVADAYGLLGTNLTSTNLPADGYIAFFPSGYDGNVIGAFYVTNKSGFFFPLSGLNATNGYYSFIELDTYVIFNPSGHGFDLGFGDTSCDVASYSLTSKPATGGGGSGKPTITGSGTGTSAALIYIHDNPYVYNDADEPDEFFSGLDGNTNLNAIEIRGMVTTQLKFTGNAVPTLSGFSVTGTGNCMLNGVKYLSLVSSGKAALSP